MINMSVEVLIILFQVFQINNERSETSRSERVRLIPPKLDNLKCVYCRLKNVTVRVMYNLDLKKHIIRT